MQSSENTHPSEPELEKSLESTTKLKLRVEDWKGYNVMLLGDLLLQDIMPIETPKSTRIYEVFLFEKIFLACKILSSGFNTFYMKPRDGSSGKIKDRTTGLLQLKGRIFMRDIKQVQSAVDADSKSLDTRLLTETSMAWLTRHVLKTSALSKSSGKTTMRRLSKYSRSIFKTERN
jgi:hypothetical protein